MCGIFGIITGRDSQVAGNQLRRAADTLFRLSESRGKEASGIAYVDNHHITIYKLPLAATTLIKEAAYRQLFRQPAVALIGHSRLATNGHQSDNFNNQPVVAGSAIGVHNGIIVNDETFWKKLPRLRRHFEVDTEALLAMISSLWHRDKSLSSAVAQAFAAIEGSATIAALLTDTSKLILATNTGSLFTAVSQAPRAVVFASEEYILRTFLQRVDWRLARPDAIAQVAPGQACLVDIFTRNVELFILQNGAKKVKSPAAPRQLFSLQDLSPTNQSLASLTFVSAPLNSVVKLKRHVPDYDKIHAIRRCSRCVMPATMPLISFDRDGVCIFCRTYERIKPKGRQALLDHVAPYRKTNGKPDCIVAFSGGRDSSFGLHYVKNVLKMKPVAYTYDWGMVTDLARQNEARMVGKLGIEHIIVSADINQKLYHIRQHIEAWLKKPDLGMVPLFMEGDKQAEYFVEELARKMGIELIIYCRGNKLEDERFKFGHVGIFDGTPDGVIHQLSWYGKLQIALYYARQYVTNPAYINSSLLDTLLAYFALYLQKHNFIYLWHYIPWNEQEIISTLRQKYNWTTANDSTATWRTDDGTSAFYNYIYYQIQGFTEHDGFRSNQIREGIMTRNEAIRLVNSENRTRYEALKWYFDRVGLEGDRVLSVIDSVPTRY